MPAKIFFFHLQDFDSCIHHPCGKRWIRSRKKGWASQALFRVYFEKNAYTIRCSMVLYFYNRISFWVWSMDQWVTVLHCVVQWQMSRYLPRYLSDFFSDRTLHIGIESINRLPNIWSLNICTSTVLFTYVY